MQSETLTFDQVHLGVPNPEAAAQWYRQYLGAGPGDHVDRVMFGQTRFIFLKNEAPAASRGSAIDHVGLSFVDLDAQMDTLKGSGMRVTTAINAITGRRKSGFIEDPWGARIELLEDPATTGLHHVHLQVPDPEVSRCWYLEMVGGERGQLWGTTDGLRYGDVWLLADPGAGVPSPGHTLDHIGWRTADLLATAAALKAKGVGFSTEPHPGPNAPHAPVLMSFTGDPWGVKIELLQRRDDQA